MNKSIYSKLGCFVFLGTLGPLGVAQTWDGSDNQNMSYEEGNAAPSTVVAHALVTRQGPQGPIRMDMATSEPDDHKSAAKTQKTDHENFPYPPTEDKSFPYAEGG